METESITPLLYQMYEGICLLRDFALRNVI